MTDDKTPSGCPFCGEPPKIETVQYRIHCGNYTSCAARPSVKSNDLNVALAMWENRTIKGEEHDSLSEDKS